MEQIAVAVLFLPDKRIALQRKDEGAPRSPNMLAMFGGHVEEGESPADAMKRELSEEISLETESLPLKFICSHKITVKTDLERPQLIAHVFTADIPNLDFEVYEGRNRAEAFGIEELLARKDVDPSILKLFEFLSLEKSAIFESES